MARRERRPGRPGEWRYLYHQQPKTPHPAVHDAGFQDELLAACAGLSGVAIEERPADRCARRSWSTAPRCRPGRRSADRCRRGDPPARGEPNRSARSRGGVGHLGLPSSSHTRTLRGSSSALNGTAAMTGVPAAGSRRGSPWCRAARGRRVPPRRCGRPRRRLHAACCDQVGEARHGLLHRAGLAFVTVPVTPPRRAVIVHDARSCAHAAVPVRVSRVRRVPQLVSASRNVLMTGPRCRGCRAGRGGPTPGPRGASSGGGIGP